MKQLVRGGLGGRVHAVLRDFVNAARRRPLMEAEKLVERSSALTRRIGLFDCLGDVGLRQDRRIAKMLPARQLRRKRRGECATRAVRIRTPHVFTAERVDSRGVAQHIGRLL